MHFIHFSARLLRQLPRQLSTPAGFSFIALMTLLPLTSHAQIDTDVEINEVFYLGDASQDWIELRNVGLDTVNISDWWFCTRFAYRPLSSQAILVGDDLMLDPGEIIVLTAGVDINGTTGADIGLYITDSFGNSNNMVDFLQWITPNRIGRSNEAINRNFWLGNIDGPVDFVDGASGNQSVSFCGVNGGGSLLSLGSDFVNGEPTMGLPNSVSCDEEILFDNSFESLRD